MVQVKSADGTTIAFERSGAGPAVVLIDAAGGFREFGPARPLAAELASSFTVYAYDRRGRGDSGDTPPYAVEREVEDLAALIELAGGTAFVHGYSSGAVLALHGAVAGLPISKLTLLEPPLELDDQAQPDTTLENEIAALVAADRRGDAFEHFNRSIGVPDEYVTAMRDQPWWPAAESLAHTLVYDLQITRSMTGAPLRSVGTPTLIMVSEETDDRLKSWAGQLSEALPNGSVRSLPGEWHGVAPDVLARAMAEFFES